ncbi:unnamed protein product [Diatraea saccharalis]|uniref:G-protein coupled receptors family 1 profile domain-containing protein n=1 Tax=Diatraea saccharalis TaxID=40085 RepID=A0A9P0G103_9NEOP|nr:unnamed protein product [Diatraea saccharalis]
MQMSTRRSLTIPADEPSGLPPLHLLRLQAEILPGSSSGRCKCDSTTAHVAYVDEDWMDYVVWIFGDVWCSVWLAVDVWMCTASILNLCVISLDRYVAVTRPVSYPSIMSRKRAKALIAGLWILSFVICFPPLVWKDKKPEEKNPPCEWTCELTNDTGYVVYSALGSFYIPMFVMLFFYWRIYKAAVRTTKAINQGFRTTKGKGLGNRFDDNRLTLRIHRGRGSARPHGSPLSTASNHSTSTSLSASPERLRRHSSARRAHEKVKISVSYPSSEQICPVIENSRSPSRSPSPSLYAVHYERDGRELTESRLRVKPPHHLAPGPLYDEYDDKPRATRRMGKRNIKAQVKRFRMETKAAKTLGIIVGGFVFCWLPFFSVYVVRAFCGECVTPIVFSVLFWLGYCNSAINPLIYALFSKDFRFAFKRIICKCFCGGGGVRRESDEGSARRANHKPQHSHSLDEHDTGHTHTTTASER